MKLAHKALNRLRREVRHAAAYTRARVFDTEPTENDVLDAWDATSRPSDLRTCINEWIAAKPGVFVADLKPTSDMDAVCREANRLIHGPITIFQQPCSLKTPALWHEDPLTHRSWPVETHFTRFRVFHPSRDGITDIRRLWEVGRFGWALPLARAFASTGRADYARAWSGYVTSFIETNPPEFGPHWLNAMEVSIRAIQWCRALALFFSRQIPPGGTKNHSSSELLNLNLLLPSLLVHGRYIRAHPEWTPYGRTNHYLANLIGLLTLSVFIPQFRESEEWQSFAKQRLIHEIKIQTNGDSFHAEASTSYHRFALELYTLAAAMNQHHRLGFPPSFHKRVREMLKVDMMIRGVDDLDPRIGDDDSGTIFPQIPPSTSSRRMLIDLISLKSQPAETSTALRQSGIYILRSKSISCHIACGPNGQQGVGGHAHNDKLSIVLTVKGRPIVVDPGTCCYSADIRLRDRFRSTAMHNTITINGQEQSPLEDWRKLRDRAHARCLAWHDSADETFFLGRHIGYKKLKRIHRRTIQLNKRHHQLFVLDEIEGEGFHTLDFHLHFASWITRENMRVKSGCVRLPGGEFIFPETLLPEILDTTVSPVYGHQAPNLTLHFRMEARDKWRLPWEFRAYT